MSDARDGIAIIGMAGHFPGAATIEAFWANLVAGRESISVFTDEELRQSGLDPEALRRRGHYVAARGVLEGAETFDAAFFGVHPKEAEVMDPQQRVFLEVCWTALERAGYAPNRVDGAIGVFAGATFNTFHLHALHQRPALVDLVGAEQVMFGNEKDYLTTRVAYKLGLKGPALNIATACSTSLVAVVQACQSLLIYQSDLALAGAVSVTVPQKRGYFHDDGNIGSADGHTRTFDIRASGTVFSNGVGVVVLKRLEEALADGDQIYAVIKGTAINNDGSQRVSFGAPGVDGQAKVIAMAHALAGVDPATIAYVEAHGTATPLGDPIEVAALTKAFRLGTDERQYCAIGSVKTNVGHLDVAAGVAGLIKTALALHHRMIPASLHFTAANPRLELERSPFYVNTALEEWPSRPGTPRRAGVSSFGTGGTNAHVVLEEAPDVAPSGPSRQWQQLALSAKTPDALDAMTVALSEHLAHIARSRDVADAARQLADAAFTLHVGRTDFACRRIVICRDAAAGAAALASRDARRVFSHHQPRRDPPVIFMFPGQGAQYAGMGSELYRSEAVFRAEVDRCAEVLQPVLDLDLRCVLFPTAGAETEADRQLLQTCLTQPALFTIEYALARLWMSWGIRPAAMVGHSVGEYVAGCLAGVFTLDDALTLIARRGALVQEQPPGAMLAVRMPEREIRPLLEPRLAIAAVNAPNLCVVSGPHEAVAALERAIESKGAAARRLHTSHAFHSAMMEPVAAPFTDLLRNVSLREPKIPFVSNVTGRWITAGEATSPEYWATHLRDTVRFADGVAELMRDPHRVFLEVGPGQTLSTLTRQHPARPADQLVLASMPEPDLELGGVLESLGRLWMAGAAVDWESFYRGERRRRVVLPTYPFERKRYWPDQPIAAEDNAGAKLCATSRAATIVEPPCVPSPAPIAPVPAPTPNELPSDRRARLGDRVRQTLEELSGTSLAGTDPAVPFLELGLDSLLLTQAGTRLQAALGVRVSFRQLMEELSSVEALVAHLDRTLPREQEALGVAGLSWPVSSGAESGRGTGVPRDEPAPQPACVTEPAGGTNVTRPDTSVGPFKGIDRSASSLTTAQQAFLDQLVARYTARTQKSKAHAQAHRRHFADPRTMAGFRPYWKEMVYPIVVERSSGARMWDIDGNEYIDFTMGFGTNLAGHSPPFVTTALEAQLKRGVEVGPQTPLAGNVAAMMCELTGMERCTFVNTGSEAVLAAIRLARTVTGRTQIVYFTGDYHGIVDEVLQRAAGTVEDPRLVPVAPGIPVPPSEHVLILGYDRPESLDIIRARGSDIAAVIVEPVQSRCPDVQPRAFLQKLREVTRETGSALVFDELITGFRAHQGGVQALFGIRADIATYGKIIGGGMPIGAVCGSAQYLDALDGGFWQYGDASVPETGVTFFAGTYVRHPLAIAGAAAMLDHLRREGPALQQRLNERMTAVVAELNAFLSTNNVPIRLEHFSSFFWASFEPRLKYANLLFFLLRDHGIHIFEGRLFFLSTAHTDADVRRLVEAFKDSVLAMQQAGFLGESRGQLSLPARGAPPPLAPLGAAPTSRASRTSLSAARIVPETIDFGVYFFGNYPAAYAPDKYRAIIEAAKYADAQGFSSIWIPERHFHAVGGFSPNPAVVAAALARETKSIQLRAGSVVLPLHHPIRVAEEWSVVDNLSDGRVGLSVASGWHPNDFVFTPDAYDRRREIATEGIEILRRLWAGESVPVRGGTGNALAVSLFPMPKQRQLPLWLTCVQASSYEKAGELGIGVLAMLTNQKLDEVAEKIDLYRQALARHGHDPANGHVTVLVHTFVGPVFEEAVARARGPMREYLRSYLDNSQKRHESGGASPVAADDINYLLDRAFDDYVKGKALIGTPASCLAIVESLRQAGVNELGCFLDFGVDAESMLAGLPHLAELKRRCDRPVGPRAPDASLPLTESQQGLWLLTRLTDAANRAYAESTTLRWRGPLDVDLVRRAVQAVVDRHEGLRTTINPDGETQTTHGAMTVEVPLTDLSGVPPEDHARAVKDAFARIESHTLDLVNGPMIQAELLRLEADHHFLVLTFHHLYGNGPSYEVFFEELCELYSAFRDGRPPALDPPMQLSDYVRWRGSQIATPEFERDRQFWTAQFAGTVPVLDLPADRRHPPVMTFRGRRASLTLDAALTGELRETSGRLRASLFMTLFAGFTTLVSRLAGQDDVVVGVPFEGAVRTLPGGHRLFANTTNLIPLRSRIDPDEPFADFLARTKTLVLEANDHQSYFFGRLLQDLKLRPDPSRSPIVAVSFNFERGIFKRSIGEASVELVLEDVPFANPTDASKFELTVNIADLGDRLRIDCDHSADLFDAETVARWLGHYRTLLGRIAATPTEHLGGLDLLVEAEREQVTTGWNATAAIFGPPRTIHECFERQVERTPDARAVIWNGTALTYGELNRRANLLAHGLRNLGVGPDVIVPVFLDRSPQMVVALIGILKAGGAYLPIDPVHPAERVAFMLEESRTPVVVTEAAHLGSLGRFNKRALVLDRDLPGTAQAPDDPPTPAATSESLAYVIYTSGSTGRPKGVQIEHRSVVNLLNSMRREPGLAPDDVLLAVTTVSFDIASLELFLPLTTGATVAIAPRDAAGDVALLQEELQRSGATVMQATPVTWQMLLEAGWRGDRRLKILCGGEAMPRELAEALLPRCRELWNMYGPTETTIYSTCRRITDSAEIDIGRPIANTDLLILDRRSSPVPIGVAGDLLIGGAGVARGYLDRPELTAERFVPHPLDPARRVYRTGDLARWQPDGRVEFLGRADTQVKIRGFRVELGEVESALRASAGVEDAVAVLREDVPGDRRLVAYLKGRAIQVADLRARVARTLPDHAIPSAFVHVDAWPLLPNGKLNRNALPAPTPEDVGHEPVFMAPRTATEQQLARLWQDVLGVSEIGARDDFFLLGGHSLLAMRLLHRIHEQLGVHLPPGTLFEHSVLEDLARALEPAPVAAGSTASAAASTVLVRIAPGGPGTPFFWVNGIADEVFSYMQLSRRLGTSRPVYGFTSDWTRLFGGDTPTLEGIAALYIRELKKVRPSGPYHLGGFCSASMLAFEMARQLEASGDQVGVLAALDYAIGTCPAASGAVAALAFVRNLPRWLREDALASGAIDLLGRFRSKLRRLSRRLRSAGPAGNGAGPGDLRDEIGMWRFPDTAVPVLVAHHATIRRYQPQPIGRKVTLFLPCTAPLFGPWPIGHDRMWDRLARGGVEVHFVPGSHSTMLVEPFAAELAARLDATIEASERVGTTGT